MGMPSKRDAPTQTAMGSASATQPTNFRNVMYDGMYSFFSEAIVASVTANRSHWVVVTIS